MKLLNLVVIIQLIILLIIGFTTVFVTINKEKMSKSLGNIITISNAIKKYSGQVVRLTLLSAHYSQPLDWNEQLLLNQNNIIDKWYNLYENVK